MLVIPFASQSTEVLLIHAPYPGKLRFLAPPSSLLSAIAPFAGAVARGDVPGSPALGILDPGNTSRSFYRDLRAVIRGGAVRVVCVSTSTAAIEETAKIARTVREEADAGVLLIVGGPHEDEVDQKVAEKIPGVDLSIGGDAEHVLAFVLQEFLTGGLSRAAFVSSLRLRLRPRRLGLSSGIGVVTGPWGRVPFDFGPPGLDTLGSAKPRLDRVTRFDAFGNQPTIPLMVSKGCPYGKCTFCSEAGVGQARLVATDFDWVRQVIEENPGSAFYFQDSIFPFTPAVRHGLLPMLRESGVRWGCQVYLRSLSRRMVQELAQAGCSYLYTGVESGSSEVLAAAGKVNIDRDLVVRRAGWISELGMRLGVSLMFGVMRLDGRLVENSESIDATLDLAHELNRTAPIQGFYPNVQTVLPGTPLARGLGRTFEIDFYRMPRTPSFRRLEDGGVGHNFATLGQERGSGCDGCNRRLVSSRVSSAAAELGSMSHRQAPAADLFTAWASHP